MLLYLHNNYFTKMQFEQFKTLIDLYKKGSDNISALYDIGVDLLESKYEMSSVIHDLLFKSLESHYTKDGIDWVTWFIFENEYGTRKWNEQPVYRISVTGKMEKLSKNDPTAAYGAHDENGKPICYSLKSLHEYVEEYHQINNTK